MDQGAKRAFAILPRVAPAPLTLLPCHACGKCRTQRASFDRCRLSALRLQYEYVRRVKS